MNNRELSVILPTYNESGNIVELVERIFSVSKKNLLDSEVVVVDDNSPDGTAERVSGIQYHQDRIRLIVRNKERGLATAIKKGLVEASREIVVVMDTDFNHNPDRIPLMVKYLDDFDIVVGSRFVSGGGMKGSKLRYWGSYIFNAFIKLMLGVRSNDNLSGFFATRKSLLTKLPTDFIFQGYGDYFIRLLYLIDQGGFSLLEVPVVYDERLSGESKTNFISHLVDYIITVLRLSFTTKFKGISNAQ
jgi:dolichol-phosphate mannosyltransferase